MLYRRCDWGRHRVFDDGGMMVSLHGISACAECREDHDSACGCERCRRVGWCPVHGYDLAACTAQYIVWGVGFGDSNPGGLEAVDLVDNEDRTVIAAHDPDFDEGDFDETAYYPRWAMIVEADRDILQALQAAGAIRGFAPRF